MATAFRSPSRSREQWPWRKWAPGSNERKSKRARVAYRCGDSTGLCRHKRVKKCACASCFPFNYARGKSAREHQTLAKDSTAGVACAEVLRAAVRQRRRFFRFAQAEPPVCRRPRKPFLHAARTLTLTRQQPRLGGSFLVLARGVCCAQLNGKQEALPEPRSCQPALPPQRSSENRVAWFCPSFTPPRAVKPASKDHCMPMSCGKVKRHFRQPGYRPERINT